MYELSRNEKYAIKWFQDNGYEVEVKKQWNSKTILHIEGQGLDFDFELMSGIENIKAYMKWVGHDLDMRHELLEVEKQV